MFRVYAIYNKSKIILALLTLGAVVEIGIGLVSLLLCSNNQLVDRDIPGKWCEYIIFTQPPSDIPEEVINFLGCSALSYSRELCVISSITHWVQLIELYLQISSLRAFHSSAIFVFHPITLM